MKGMKLGNNAFTMLFLLTAPEHHLLKVAFTSNAVIAVDSLHKEQQSTSAGQLMPRQG